MKTARAHRKFAIYSGFLDTILEGEEDVLDGETRKDALKRILKDLEETAAELKREYNNGAQPTTETVRSFTPQQTGASVMEIQTERGDPNDVLYQVQNAPSLEVLATYKTLATNSKTLYPAYCERLKYLSA